MGETLDRDRAIRVLRALTGKLETRPEETVELLSADVGLIAGLLADEMERRYDEGPGALEAAREVVRRLSGDPGRDLVDDVENERLYRDDDE